MSVEITYEVLTGAGALMRTFDRRQAAVNFARDSAAIFPGLRVVEVTYREPLRRTIPHHLRSVA